MMRRIAVTLGERVHLSVAQGTDSLTVLSESPGRSVEAVGWAGRVTPAYCTSAGRALLLDMAPVDVERLFAGVEFVAHGPRTVRGAGELAQRMKVARAQGYAVVDEEFAPDLIGVAVPIRDAKGRIIASLNVSAPRFRFVRRIDEAAAVLTAGAAELSGELGAPELANAAQPPAS